MLQNNLYDLVALIWHNNSVNLSFHLLFQDDVTVCKSTSWETRTPCHLQDSFQRYNVYFLDTLPVSKGLQTLTEIIVSFLYGNNSYYPNNNYNSTSAYEVKNNCCLFGRLFEVKKNGVFLFGIPFSVLEIFTFLYYANEGSDDVINSSTKTIKY